jgi:hypothetical protein
MNSFLNKLGKQIFKDRIKPFIILYLILLIAYLFISFYALKDHRINFFYTGIGQIIMALFWFLMGIEHFLLKKKMFSILWFIMTLIGIYLAIQTFGLLNIKR